MKTASLLWDQEDAVEQLEDLAQPERPLDNADHRPASSAFPIRLSDRWQIAFDPRQWILQHQKGGRWRDRCFCVTRSALQRCIREYAGKVDADALARVRGLPSWHPDRTRGGR
jgi:hypothetical protein